MIHNEFSSALTGALYAQARWAAHHKQVENPLANETPAPKTNRNYPGNAFLRAFNEKR